MNYIRLTIYLFNKYLLSAMLTLWASKYNRNCGTKNNSVERSQGSRWIFLKSPKVPAEVGPQTVAFPLPKLVIAYLSSYSTPISYHG